MMRVTATGQIVGSDFEGSDYVLIDVLDGTKRISDVVYDYRGVSITCKLVSSREKTYVYAYLDQSIVSRTTDISAIIAAHFGNYPCYYNEPTHIDNINLYIDEVIKTKKIQIGKIQQKIDIGKIEELKKSKISGEHHIHYTANEIWEILTPSEKRKAKLALSLPPDSTTTFVAGVMLWLAVLDDDEFRFIMSSKLFQAQNQKDWSTIAKAISVRAKSLQNQNAKDLRNLFEIDVLINRYLGEPIWQEEKKNRTEPKLALVSKNEVYDIAKNLFSKKDEYKEKPRKFKWKDFWDARWQWSATGSIHSQYQEDNKYICKERELKNKFISLNKMPAFGLKHFTSRKPEIRAWTSVKYEWAKLRAIYGTDLTSYVITHFAFYNCEDTLPMEFPVGDKARPSFVSARVEATLSSRDPFCLDFEDFNSQHSNENMQAVMQAWLDVHKNTISEEQYEAGLWAVESVGNTIIEDKMGTGTTYKSNGTLMSGWRMTTFVNSVLNYVYTQIIMKGTDELVHSIHNGDDVLIGLRKPKTISRMLSNARQRQIRTQNSKCAYAGIAEFLRVDHKRGEYGQYITRSIATILHARIESKVAISTVDYLEALESRLFDFKMRSGNMDMAVRLREKYYERMSLLYKISIDDLFSIKSAHRVCGGMSQLPDSSVNKYIRAEKKGKMVDLEDNLPGVSDYSEKLVNDLKLKVERGKVYDGIYRATLDAVQLVRKHVNVEDTVELGKYRVLRGIYGAYSSLRTNVVLGKAMLTGFAIDVLASKEAFDQINSMLAAAQDPMLYLKTVC